MATDEGGTKNGISASPTNLGLSIGPKLSHPQTPKPNTNNTLLGIKPILLELTTNQFSPIMEPNKENRKRPVSFRPSTSKQTQLGSPITKDNTRPDPMNLDIPKQASNNKDVGYFSELDILPRSSHSISLPLATKSQRRSPLI